MVSLQTIVMDLCLSHNFFKDHPDGLQIIAYFDEIEVCNPLGAQSGVHKLGIFEDAM